MQVQTSNQLNLNANVNPMVYARTQLAQKKVEEREKKRRIDLLELNHQRERVSALIDVIGKNKDVAKF